MKKIIKPFVFLICIGTLAIISSSCDSKQNALSRLEVLTEELQNNSKHYTQKEWDEASIEMDEIETLIEQNQSDYSEEDLKEIGRLKGICLAFFTKESARSLRENMKNLLIEAEGFVEGFKEGISNLEETE